MIHESWRRPRQWSGTHREPRSTESKHTLRERGDVVMMLLGDVTWMRHSPSAADVPVARFETLAGRRWGALNPAVEGACVCFIVLHVREHPHTLTLAFTCTVTLTLTFTHTHIFVMTFTLACAITFPMACTNCTYQSQLPITVINHMCQSQLPSACDSSQLSITCASYT